MTAFPGAGSALDRVGGESALRAVLEETGSVDLEVDVIEVPGFFVLGLFDVDGRLRATLRDVRIARSAAVRDDQEALLASDRAELATIVRRILDELLPESEKRALHGDR